jgi:hypothetical protein
LPIVAHIFIALVERRKSFKVSSCRADGVVTSDARQAFNP